MVQAHKQLEDSGSSTVVCQFCLHFCPRGVVNRVCSAVADHALEYATCLHGVSLYVAQLS